MEGLDYCSTIEEAWLDIEARIEERFWEGRAFVEGSDFLAANTILYKERSCARQEMLDVLYRNI